MLPIKDTADAFVEIFSAPMQGSKSGLLSNLTFAAKDNMDVAGKVTGNGNPSWRAAHKPAKAHAAAVASLLAEGASLVGTTHMDEFAYSLMGTNAHYGAPLNTAAPERVPGGSSSGSASAVAAGLVDFALGTDTGGSVRLPASFCGIFGIRPSHGAVDMRGVFPLSPGFDTLGWFAHDATLLAIIGRVLGLSGVSYFSVPWMPVDVWEGVDPALAAALRPSAENIASRIGQLITKPLPTVGPLARADTYRFWQGRDTWNTIGKQIEKISADFGPDIAARFATARSVDDATFSRANDVRNEIATAMEAALAHDVVLIIPTAPGPAPRLDSSQSEFNAFRIEALGLLSVAGHAGLPQISMPSGQLDGAPVGLSLIGRKGTDGALLSLAEAL
jgi:amidase